ncbi:MAG: hypothetical protein ACMUIU_01795 [bacterium]
MKPSRICNICNWFLPGIALLMVILLPLTAFAGVGGSAVPDIQNAGPLVLGNTYPASLTLTNSSNFEHSEDPVEVTKILYTPSCGRPDQDGICDCPADCDPDVFEIVGPIVGTRGSCKGCTFTANLLDPLKDEYEFIPGSSCPTISLGETSSGDPNKTQCEISFSLKVLKWPEKDSKQDPCLQTSQLGYMSLLHPFGEPGEGAGTNSEPFYCQPTVTTTPDPSGSVPVGTVLQDKATVISPQHISCNPTGTVTFRLFAPGDPNCDGNPVYTETVDLVDGFAQTGFGYPSDTPGIYQWTAEYSGDQCNLPASSVCGEEPVEIYGNPNICVEKDVNPKISKISDEVEYELGPVCNCGNLVLNDVKVEDTILGDVTGLFFPGTTPRTLQPGQCVPSQGVGVKVSYTIKPTDPDPLVNVLTASGKPPVYDRVTDTATASVNLFQPAIKMDKTGDTVSKVGDDVNYTIKLCNNSSADTPDLECKVTDPMLGIDKSVTLPSGACDETKATYKVQSGDPDPLKNTASAVCSPIGFDNELKDSDDHSVDLVQPSAKLTKTCTPDQMNLGDTITWTITRCNTSPDTVVLRICVDDPVAGIVNDCVDLSPGQCDDIEVDANTTECGTIYNEATGTATVIDPPLGNVYPLNASSECEVVCREVCRTPGFWATHACPETCPGDYDMYCEKSNSNNITLAVIDEGGGSLDICGYLVTNTVGTVEVGHGKNLVEIPSSDPESALEAMCVRVKGEHKLQLIRQLTAAALNCIVSNGSSDCSGVSIGPIFEACNAACKGDPSPYTVEECIYAIDCWNNGGRPAQIDSAWFCQPMYPSCHERMIGVCEDGTVCTEGNTTLTAPGERLCGDGSVCGPTGPAGSSKACNSATQNDCTLLDASGCELDQSCP